MLNQSKRSGLKQPESISKAKLKALKKFAKGDYGVGQEKIQPPEYVLDAVDQLGLAEEYIKDITD